MHRYLFILLVVTTCCSFLPAAEEIDRQKRVLGGTAYDVGQYPFHVSLWYFGNDRPDKYKNLATRHLCGGSLIHKQWVMTVAHCINGQYGDQKKWKVYVNVYNQSEATYDDDRGHSISLVVPHPEYNTQAAYHKDIALLKLEKPVECGSLGDIETDSNCPMENLKLIGWGQTNTGSSCNSVNIQDAILVKPLSADASFYTLNYRAHTMKDIVSDLPQISIALDEVDTKKCNAFFNQKKVLNDFKVKSLKADDFTLCAGVSERGRNSCYGDSGSPLLANCNGNTKIVGIDSYGYGEHCNLPDSPSLYTRVSAFSDWIQETIDKNP